jgi:hypothetical protein
MQVVKTPVFGMDMETREKKVVKPGVYKSAPSFFEWERRTKLEAEQGAALRKIEEARQLQEQEVQQQQHPQQQAQQQAQQQQREEVRK